MSPQPASDSILQRYKFHALVAGYLVVTGGIFFRISKQPYNQAIKWEQYESVFKATTLATLIAGIGMGSIQRRSQREASER